MLQRMVNYYLDCLDAESGWRVSSALRQKGRRFLVPALYSEWNSGPDLLLEMAVEADNEAMVKEMQQKKASLGLFYGWPLLVYQPANRRTQSVAPLFLQPVDWKREDGVLKLTLVQDAPHVNDEFLAQIYSSNEERQLCRGQFNLDAWEELGSQGWMKQAAEKAVALFGHRIVEPLDPDNLASPGKPICEPGLHNKAIVSFGERPRFTIGVEQELRALRKEQGARWQGTALAPLFGVGKHTSTRNRRGGFLVEACPLNREQKLAVAGAFNKPFTVVTGPPGTGKSQVVVATLANAFIRGEKALFTSRNQKAVSVVEERLNRLAGAPIVVRLGGNTGERDFRRDLSDFIGRILASSSSDERRREYERACSQFQALQERYGLLRRQLAAGGHDDEAARAARSKLDSYKEKLGDKLVEELIRASSNALPSSILSVPEIVKRHAGQKPGWFAFSEHRSRRKDAQAVETSVYAYRRLPDAFGELPEPLPVTQEWDEWVEPAGRLSHLFRTMIDLRQISAFLKRCSSKEATKPEDIEQALEHLSLEMAEAGMRVISSAVETLPDRLDPERRKALSEFRSIIDRLAEGEPSGRVRAGLYQDLTRIMPKISALLPIWCVTNLSARSSLPFLPGLFDLVVIDEASQCDIPSAMPVLYRGQRAMIIGDVNQLRHVSTLGHAATRRLEQKHGLSSAQAQMRAHDRNSLFDLSAAASEEGPIMLREHFRSHPEVIAFSNGYWYANNLVTKTDPISLRAPGVLAPGLIWRQVEDAVERSRYGGAVSASEAEEAVNTLVSLTKDASFTGTVGIVTPFRAQANLISELIKSRIALKDLERMDVIVDTAHGFQGDERDVVIFSPVVGDGLPDAAKRFLAQTSNLFNVALTRAKATLVVVANRNSLSRSGIDYLEKFAGYTSELEKRKSAVRDDAAGDAEGLDLMALILPDSSEN